MKSFILLPLGGAVFSAMEQVMKTVFAMKKDFLLLLLKKQIYVLLYQLNVPLRVKTIGRKTPDIDISTKAPLYFFVGFYQIINFKTIF